MSHLIHFLNGKFVPEEEFLISPRDLGYVRGYAVTDFLVTYNHKPFKLPEHIDRLFHSAEIIDLELPWSKTQIFSWVTETLSRNNTETEKSIKIIISGGISHSLHQSETPTIAIIISPRERKSESDYENGIRVAAVKYTRPYPEAKHTNYIEAIRQLARLRNDGINDLIYYDDTHVTEGSGCSLFAVIDGKLITAKTDVIDGITRKTLLEILRLDIPIEVRDFTLSELMEASEVFVTGSNSEVRGIVQIDGKQIGDGRVGRVTREALRQYREYIQKAL